MENKIVSGTIGFIFFVFVSSCSPDGHPEPYGALPSGAQMEWQHMAYYMFVHFGPNTFTDVEWGSGLEDPAVFNPSELDCLQWVATAKAAGMKGIIITAKHHDGFCLWPSRFSDHTVAQSTWLEGRGDVLKELSSACREYGLKFGIYLSPWDRNHPRYGTAAYNRIFASTLEEVLTSYGPVFEQWFDGACGDLSVSPYDWDLFNRTVREHQPQAVIFSDVGPGCRWVGNETGYAGETNWSTMDTSGYSPGKHAPPFGILNSGQRGGPYWIPAEADVSIRPGWFYSPATDDQLKTVDQLMDIYFGSVGRNANLLLNVPPDRRGRIPAGDSIRLMEFKERRDSLFSVNLAGNARVTVSNQQGGGSRKFRPAGITDNDDRTYWKPADDRTTASFTLHFDRPVTFSVLSLGEYIPLGQRVARFIAEYSDPEDGKWQLFARGTTIGYRRMFRFRQVTSEKVRISILEAGAPPLINRVELY